MFQLNFKSKFAVKEDLGHSKIHIKMSQEPKDMKVQSGFSNQSARASTNTSRSPIRSLGTTQRLRTPGSQLHQRQGSLSQRRSSLVSVEDFSSSLGVPYTYAVNTGSAHGSLSGNVSPSTPSILPSLGSGPLTGNNSAISSRTPIMGTGAVSSRSSPRSSFSSSFDSFSTASFRRHSEITQRRPSAEEVFDLMEREQDAIVLKLMREIQQLKEDNRALLQTINVLTAAPSSQESRATFQDVRSRRRSSFIDEDWKANLQRADSIPRSSRFDTYNGIKQAPKPVGNDATVIKQ